MQVIFSILQLVDVISQMPILTVTWKLKSHKQDKQVEDDLLLGDQKWVDVDIGEECVVVMEITKRNLHGKVHVWRKSINKYLVCGVFISGVTIRGVLLN